MSEPVYPTVDPAELEPEYSEHHRRLLNGSVPLLDIAYQLALRDREIARLRSEHEALEWALSAVHAFFDDDDFLPEQVPVEVERIIDERDAALARVRELEGELTIEQDGHTETARSLSALEARIRELTEWRPMETAPRDGSVIGLILSDGTATVGEWCEHASVWDTQYGVFEDKDEHRPPEPGEAWPVGWHPLPEVRRG